MSSDSRDELDDARKVIDLAARRLDRMMGEPRVEFPTTEDDFSRMADLTREEIDAKIAAAEARNETGVERVLGEVRSEFAALRGDIRELKASSAGKNTVVITAVTLFFGIAGLLIAIFAYGGDRFGAGVQQSDAIEAAVTRALDASQRPLEAPPPPKKN